MVEHRPAKQKVASLVPGQGTCLGCGPVPDWGTHERQPIVLSLTHEYFSPSLSSSLPPSLKINKYNL